MEDIIHDQYVYEQKLFTAIKTSTVLALFLSCIGLGGLASLSARSKTKEIGIRKVFGASVTDMTTLFSKKFIKVVMSEK